MKEWLDDIIEEIFGSKIIIFDGTRLWRKPNEYPKDTGNIFYKSGKFKDYRIEFWDVRPIMFLKNKEELAKNRWEEFTKEEGIEKWCYLKDLLNIIDNDEFKTGDRYIINHI